MLADEGRVPLLRNYGHGWAPGAWWQKPTLATMKLSRRWGTRETQIPSRNDNKNGMTTKGGMTTKSGMTSF